MPGGAQALAPVFADCTRSRVPLRWIQRSPAHLATAIGFALTALANARAASPEPRPLSVALAPPPASNPGFSLQSPSLTGVAFTNPLRGDASLTNAVAHNGSGVAIGDIDGDGLPDLYFCRLQGPNELYRNLGHWRFAPLPAGAIACTNQLSTGAAFADVDGDNDLDLLVNGIAAGTRLFSNDGQGNFTEVRDAGLSRSASAMSLALADIDGDGDLDLYVAHYIDVMVLSDPTTRITTAQQGGRTVITRVNDQPASQPPWKDRFEIAPDGSVQELPEVDGLYRNDGRGRFTPIQFEPGTFLDEEGRPIPPVRCWGLSAMFRDINGDGAPDLYVCNDNASPDQLWINTGKGTFRRLGNPALRHGSRSSMGVDFADIDRDGRDDFLVVDMLARDHARRVRQLVRSVPLPAQREDPLQVPLFNRNTLFLGRPGMRFTETALFAGVAATDWSWCPIFLDVDLDGYEDLLISNGFEQDVMDQDSTDSISARKWTPEQVRRYRGIHPDVRSANLALRNRGDGTFEPGNGGWGFDLVGVSNGMATGDLDGDGDLDVVINNLNGPASLYRNNAAAPRLAVRLLGRAPNTRAIGARVRLLGAGVDQSQEIIAGGRYLSGDDGLRVFAAGSGQGPGPGSTSAPSPPPNLRLEIRWPDGRFSSVSNLTPNRLYTLDQTAATFHPAPTPAPEPRPIFEDATPLLVGHAHVENEFDDWSRQTLLPGRQSRRGPGVAWIDFNADGWEDLIVTAARDGKPGVFASGGGGPFRLLQGSDRAVMDHEAIVGWCDGSGTRKFLMTLSNFELAAGQDSHIRVYSPRSAATRFATGPGAPGPLAVADIDGDADLDVFLGGRPIPGRYPEPAPSLVWLAQGSELVPAPEISRAFAEAGVVSGAVFADLDDNGFPDLVLAVEWGPVRVFLNQSGKFTDQTSALGLDAHRGRWTSVAVGDFDSDGRLDLVAGNWGRNSIYEIHSTSRWALFHGDWNGDGTVQAVEAWKSGTNWFPMHDRKRLEAILPDLKPRFPTHQAYGTATVPEILGSRNDTARRLEISELESAVLLNRGTRFQRIALPREAQFAPALSVNVGDIDNDGIEDLFLCQNFLGTTSDISRDDGGLGLWLRGLGDGRFRPLDPGESGVLVTGESRAAALGDFNHDGRVDLAVGQNNGPTRLFVNRSPRRGVRVALQGPPANPTGVGARIRVRYADGRSGPVRCVSAGSGGLSQDSPVPILGFLETPKSVEVHWPGGTTTSVPLSADSLDLLIPHPEAAK